MTIPRPLIQIYNAEAGQATVREMNDAEYSAWLLGQDVAQTALVRSERNRLIAETDWRVIKALESQEPLDFAIVEYRQQLRDIPSQPGFPWNVDWPSINLTKA